jgi:hypothetical protein
MKPFIEAAVSAAYVVGWPASPLLPESTSQPGRRW